MTGMHLSLSTIALGNIAEMGYDWLLPMNTMGTLALFGACLAVWIKAKKIRKQANWSFNCYFSIYWYYRTRYLWYFLEI